MDIGIALKVIQEFEVIVPRNAKYLQSVKPRGSTYLLDAGLLEPLDEVFREIYLRHLLYEVVENIDCLGKVS